MTVTQPHAEAGAVERTRTFTWDDPLATAEAGTHWSGLDHLRAIQRGDVPPPPIARLLDMTLDEVEEGRAVFGLEPQEMHYNPIGMVHGGVAATLCDSAMGCAVQTMLPLGTSYSTLDLNVHYVRALRAGTGRARCEASVVHVGGRVATAEARLFDGTGHLVAHATTTCLVMRPRT